MKKIIFSLSIMLMMFVNVNAVVLTAAQEKAQRSVIMFLKAQNYDPTIDTSDGSVCFHYNGVLYWVSITGDSPLLYTMHRKSFKVGTSDGYKRNTAITAANEVNRKAGAAKLTVGDNKIDISAQIYAATPEGFTSVFSKYCTRLAAVAEGFKREYGHAKHVEDSIHLAKEEEMSRHVAPSVLTGLVKGVSFRLIGINGQVDSDFDMPMRGFNAHYIQPRIQFGPWPVKGVSTFNIVIRIIKPDGQAITLPGKRFAAEGTITLEKSRRDQFVVIDEFGSSKQGYWKAGEYKIEFLESGSLFYTTSFTIL